MFSNKKVYLTSSDQTYERMIDQQLQRMGCEVVRFQTEKHCLQNLTPDIDLIILDYQPKGYIARLQMMHEIQSVNKYIAILLLLNPRDLIKISPLHHAGRLFYIEKGFNFQEQFQAAIDQIFRDEKHSWTFLETFRKRIFRIYGF
ncbi:MAG TPA: hypothetical protein VD884_15915 [Ohtaekwangia sp.]|nr:hypothetical protein [Ohtaekwangia sp.]